MYVYHSSDSSRCQDNVLDEKVSRNNVLNKEEVSQNNDMEEKVGQDFFKNAKSVNFESVEQGYFANIAEQNLVIENEQRFRDFWSSLHSNTNPLPDIPNIDFSTSLVLVSVMGGRPSGGYVVEITQVGFFNDKLGVKVQNKSPGKGCATAGVITTPYHIVKIDKSDKPVEFFEEEITVDCGE